MLSCDARNTAWVSFDGRKRQEICHGDRLVCMLPRFGYTTKQSPLIRDKKFNSLGCCINTYRLSYVTWARLKGQENLRWGSYAYVTHPEISFYYLFCFLKRAAGVWRTREQCCLRGGCVFSSFPNETSASVTLYSLLSCCSITITTSCFPVPSICFRDPVNDWFESLAQCLHWNVRKKQNYLSSEDEFWALWSL